MHTEVVNVEEPVFGEARDRTFVTGGRCACGTRCCCASGPVAVAHVLRVETGGGVRWEGQPTRRLRGERLPRELIVADRFCAALRAFKKCVRALVSLS